MEFVSRWHELFADSFGSVEFDQISRPGEQLPQEAAVLIPLTDSHDPSLILTRRARHLSTHAGQVSLPGGMWEPGDDGLHQTALRETEEEIGIASTHVDLLGYCSRRISRHGIGVTPFVGRVDSAIRPVEDSDEIDCVFQVPLRFFFEREPDRYDLVERQGVRYRMPAWYWQEHEIWGLTALILEDFFSRIRPAASDLAG